jgi:hypothetical protein
MDVPSFYLPRPPLTLGASVRSACDALLDEALQRPGIDLTGRLPCAPWQFCAYITDAHQVLLHGSQNPAVPAFVPRRSYDGNPFGDRTAVFAASDGIWPMFFALLVREGSHTTLINACFRVITPDGRRSEPYYFFSIAREVLAREPWSDGTLYVLPRDTFEQHPPQAAEGAIIQSMEWASEQTVQPIAHLWVRPADFPLLTQVRGHDEEVVRERALADPEGWPWVDQ